MNFESRTLMADLVFSNYNLLPVLNRFGIRLGFRDQTVEDICLQKGINKDFFLAIVNTYVDPSYLPSSGLLEFNPLLIVDYLKRTHQYYISYSIPRIERMLDKLVNSGKSEKMQLISKFYKEYVDEFFIHIKDEEDNLFPYVERLVHNEYDNHYKISTFEKVHTSLDEKISDLRNLIVKFLQEDYDDNACNEFLIALHNFEDDLKDHARIEDLILVPIVKKMESKLS